MSTATLSAYRLPWSPHPADEKRLFNSQLSILLPLALLMALIPHLPVFLSAVLKPEDITAVVRLIKPIPPPRPQGGGPQQLAKPRPAPVIKPAPVAKPAQSIESARARAARSGVLALGSEIATLRNSPVITSIQGDRALSRGTPQGQPSDSAAILQGVDRGSGGITTAGVAQGGSGRTSLNEGGTGNSGARGVGGTGGGSGGGRGGVGAYQPKRTSESIQLVIDRNKSAFEALYQRALRQSPALQGAVVFEMTILPSGKVTVCRVISSELKDPELESKFVSRILMLDFGAEEVPTITVTNPLRFYPQ